MKIELWFLFFCAYLFITLAPGPNVIFVVQNAVKYGYRKALLSILGNLTCQAIIVLLVACGAGAMLEKSPMAFFILKVIGGVYLIYLGVTGLLNQRRKEEEGKKLGQKEEEKAVPSCFKTGFFVSASNPKTVIFLSAFLPQFVSPDHAVTLQFLIMFASICLIVISVHLAYSYLAKNISNALQTSGLSKAFSKIYHTIFIVLGGGLILGNR
ncbi:LysE family translocator [Marinomonas sp. TW1]|uniref:LysE family translocator n=1 Tax=Marinomonas sp. TW1 TaxID=1561203 RepID=UPI0007AF21C8|nr:hypothetical protein OA79_11415 [Marinomonas sp. TW1]